MLFTKLVSAISVISTSSFSPLSIKIQNNNWDIKNINHSVETPATGTHSKEDFKMEEKATAKLSWDDLLSKSTYAEAYGLFDLHTHSVPKTYDHVQLTIKNEKSTNSFREWVYSETNDHWVGWGHQTSTITLTLDASYNDDEGITALTLNSYIYARTAGSVHSCSTTSRVDSISWLQG